jgi:hypothetical protein
VLLKGGTRERKIPTERFIQGRAETKLIARTTYWFVSVLLRGHISRSSGECALISKIGVIWRIFTDSFTIRRTLPTEARHAKVKHQRKSILSNEYVVWFEVPMNDARFVGGLEPFSGCNEDLKDLAPGPSLCGQPSAQRNSVYKLHRQIQLVVRGSDIINRDHSRVTNASERFGFA